MSTSGWHLASDSPLLGLRSEARARFVVVNEVPRALRDEPELLAGAAEADITPPPGMPKAGYSANARDGDGFRTRLRARVLHLRAGTSSIALVQCDLLGGSAVVQHLVARAIAASTDVGIEGLFIGATHTHAGPGQFLGTDFYNRFASNRSGFDPVYTQFLVDQIAGAVSTAVETRRPALVASGSAEVWGWTRNRSLPPHLANTTIADKTTTADRKFSAVNPALHVLRVDDRADSTPIAAVVLFSVHGTGISMKSSEYNADLWAYVTGTLTDSIESDTGQRPVVGAIQATHADVAPAIRPRAAGYIEAERVGAGIGNEAARLWRSLEPELTSEVPIGAVFHESDLAVERTFAGVKLSRRAAVGAALVAGAHENLTPVIHHLPPFRAGTPRPHHAGDEQGSKWVLGSRWLQPAIVPPKSFPSIIPIQILQIGHLAIVGLPFEVTVQAGRQMRAGVLQALAGAGVDDVIVSSVANEYTGYVTTAEEYSLQHYEGGHTLYGPTQAEWLSAQTAALARRLAAGLPGQGATDQNAARRRSFDLKIHTYMPTRSAVRPSPRSRVTDEPRPSYHDATATTDGYWQFDWRDPLPGDLDWHEPIVRVERLDATGTWVPAIRQGRIVNDQGWSLQVSLGPAPRGEDMRHGQSHYCARWHDPWLGSGAKHRFVLERQGSLPDVSSQPF